MPSLDQNQIFLLLSLGIHHEFLLNSVRVSNGTSDRRYLRYPADSAFPNLSSIVELDQQILESIEVLQPGVLESGAFQKLPPNLIKHGLQFGAIVDVQHLVVVISVEVFGFFPGLTCSDDIVVSVVLVLNGYLSSKNINPAVSEYWNYVG